MGKKLWIFGSGNGKTYADNSRALFEYICRNQPEIKAVWLTNDKKIHSQIKAEGNEAELFYSWKGIKVALFSHTIVLTNSFLDVSLFTYILFPRHKFIAQLWHGTPLKVLENMEWPSSKKLLINIFLFYIGRDCDIVFSATELNIPMYMNNFRVKKSQIAVTGQPRNDYLFKHVTKPKKKEIWYVPTFREFDTEYDFFQANNFDPQRMDAFLRKNNAHLYLKLHHVDANKFDKYTANLKTLKNISVAKPDNLYEALGNASILLTDYSSVYFDYLLLDKPIIFTCFDYETYKRKRDFYYDYAEVTPGPKVSNWPEVIEQLDLLFKGDDWHKSRAKVNNRFNKYQDAFSSKRVFKTIQKTIDA